jgi:DNA ligase-1
MELFAQLIALLEQTTKTLKRIDALTWYLEQAPDPDKVWTIALLSGRKPKRPVNTTLLRQWAAETANIPLWLFEDSYHIVGDLSETIALILKDADDPEHKTLAEWMNEISVLGKRSEEEKHEYVTNAWRSFGQKENFVFNKLLGGSFRIGVSQKLLTKALAKHTDVEESILAHRLMGEWDPATVEYEKLIFEENEEDTLSRPYPFYLAYPIDKIEDLGEANEWIAEWKWDGIRGQVIIRKDQVYTWSRGEELVTDKFPEFKEFAECLPNGTVLDGEILAYDATNSTPLNFNTLQTRIGRKNVTAKILKDAPVILMAYDLLEVDGKDNRETPFVERRQQLAKIIQQANCSKLQLSPEARFSSWEELEKEKDRGREMYAEGVMLKRKDSTYRVGRKRGDWWKWKVDPLSIDAVMIYAMRGSGRRANMYTDYTFAVWDGKELVPFTKAYSGLTDAELRKVDAYVKKNTIERFGPVRSVTPKLVMEIGFEGIAKSTRHKSGVALRFPRILRWRHDKPIEEADTIENLNQMLEIYG